MGDRVGRKQSSEHVQRRMASRLETLKAKPKPVSREWLEREYIVNGRNCVQIGAELQRDPKTIWEWLKHYSIPIRPRGGASSSGSFVKGSDVWTGRRHTDEARRKMRAARMADGHVPYLRDGVHWLDGLPSSAHPNWKGGVTPERQAFYTTPEWKSACIAVWHRADARCERCSLDYRVVRGEQTFHVHHIVSFAVPELRAEPSNLALLCVECHHFVHGRTNTNRDFLGRP